MLVLQGRACSCSSSYCRGGENGTVFLASESEKTRHFSCSGGMRSLPTVGASLLLVLALGHCPVPQPSSVALPLHRPGQGTAFASVKPGEVPASPALQEQQTLPVNWGCVVLHFTHI